MFPARSVLLILVLCIVLQLIPVGMHQHDNVCFYV
jgi:hypothetical protein